MTSKRTILSAAALAALLALPSPAAASGGWLDDLSARLGWLRALWTGGTTVPGSRPAPGLRLVWGETSEMIDPSGRTAPGGFQFLWGETGTEIDPLGRTAPAGGLQFLWGETRTEIDPSGRSTPLAVLRGARGGRDF
ncbi:MAG TPA: hypothetical protein VN783_05750 [Thermoanaerobaculia bacterium]|nr:hypothetical protein [Thermoanaerobaculia bacterium]